MNEVVNECDWVERGAVRLREEGHVFTGEVMVVPRASALADGDGLMERLEDLAEHLLSLEWKVYDIVVVPVRQIDIPSPGVTVGGQESTPGGEDHSAGGQDSSLSGSR
jgi:hypothetical protein